MDPREIVLWAATLGNAAIGIIVIALVLVGTPRKFPHMLLGYFLAAAMTNGFATAIAESTGDIGLAWRMEVLAAAAAAFIYAFYLMFAAANLRTPLLKPFAGTPGRLVLIAAAVAVAGWIILRPEDHFVPSPSSGALFTETRAHLMLLNSLNVALVWALVGSIHAFLRAPVGSELRKRSKAYMIAFGVQDVVVTVALVMLGASTFVVAGSGRILLALGPAIGWLLLVRAMVREHLFDVDLKIKTGISRGTLGAVFVMVFLVTTQVAENLLDERGWLVGGIATGMLLAVIQPLQRFADRVADSAMPHARNTSEYRMVRKREVYRAALESVWEDGALTEKERLTLATLADQLGLGVQETFQVEREVATMAQPVRGVPA